MDYLNRSRKLETGSTHVCVQLHMCMYLNMSFLVYLMSKNYVSFWCSSHANAHDDMDASHCWLEWHLLCKLFEEKLNHIYGTAKSLWGFSDYHLWKNLQIIKIFQDTFLVQKFMGVFLMLNEQSNLIQFITNTQTRTCTCIPFYCSKCFT